MFYKPERRGGAAHTRLRAQLSAREKDGQQEKEKIDSQIVDHIEGVPACRRKAVQSGKAADRLIAQIAGKVDEPEAATGTFQNSRPKSIRSSPTAAVPIQIICEVFRLRNSYFISSFIVYSCLSHDFPIKLHNGFSGVLPFFFRLHIAD